MSFDPSDPNTKEKGSAVVSYRATVVGGGGLYIWDRSRLVFVYGQCIQEVGVKSTREETGGLHSFRISQG